MPDQTLQQDILDKSAYAQKYGGGMASLDFAVLDEWADRAANTRKELILYRRAEQILREPIGPVCWRSALAQAREEASRYEETPTLQDIVCASGL